MHRLFVAIRPPKSIREQLLRAMGSVGGARWQSDDQLHLTVRFIGEVDRHRANDVVTALGAVRQVPFEIALRGLGTFESRGIPAAIWAGVTPHDALKALHKKVDQACVHAGLEPERRAYVPHVTLARLNRGSGPISALLESAGGLSSPAFLVDSFGLYESALMPGGSVYSIVERYRLS